MAATALSLGALACPPARPLLPRPPPQLVTAKGAPRRCFLLVALANTGAMWAFRGDAAGPSGATPLLAAALLDRGVAVAAPPEDAVLLQPDGAAPLRVPGLPVGFWRGRVRGAAGLGWY
jgi:hypothetical protein